MNRIHHNPMLYVAKVRVKVIIENVWQTQPWAQNPLCRSNCLFIAQNEVMNTYSSCGYQFLSFINWVTAPHTSFGVSVLSWPWRWHKINSVKNGSFFEKTHFFPNYLKFSLISTTFSYFFSLHSNFLKLVQTYLPLKLPCILFKLGQTWENLCAHCKKRKNLWKS